MTEDGEPRLLLVTGGAGYIGSCFLREAIASGYRVRCIDLLLYGGSSLTSIINHPRFEFVKGDILDRQLVRDALDGVAAVVHLAAIVGDRPCQVAPRTAVQVNFHGTELLAREAAAKDVEQFVMASTCSNYGVTDPRVLVTEEDDLNPVSLYAETKIDSEQLLTSMYTDSFRPTVLRFGTAFGISTRTRFDLTVNSLAYEAFADGKVLIFAADMWRPYIHVFDMSQVILEVLALPPEKDVGGICNAGFTEMNFTKRDLVRFLQASMPEVVVEFVPTASDKRTYRVDFTKLYERLGSKPSRSVEDGFAELISSFRAGILTADDYFNNTLDSIETFYAEYEERLAR